MSTVEVKETITLGLLLQSFPDSEFIAVLGQGLRVLLVDEFLQRLNGSQPLYIARLLVQSPIHMGVTRPQVLSRKLGSFLYEETPFAFLVNPGRAGARLSPS